MNAVQPVETPSPEATLKKLETYQRLHGNTLHDPNLKSNFHVDHLIPFIRQHVDETPPKLLERLDTLLTTYRGSSVQEQFEQRVSECLHRIPPVASELVTELCSAITLQIPVYFELARDVLKSSALTTSDYAIISDTFFNACAPFLAPGASTPPDHYAHSFLPVALLAKSKQLCQERPK